MKKLASTVLGIVTVWYLYQVITTKLGFRRLVKKIVRP